MRGIGESQWNWNTQNPNAALGSDKVTQAPGGALCDLHWLVSNQNGVVGFFFFSFFVFGTW